MSFCSLVPFSNKHSLLKYLLCAIDLFSSYFCSQIHSASFCLPSFAKRVIESKGKWVLSGAGFSCFRTLHFPPPLYKIRTSSVGTFMFNLILRLGSWIQRCLADFVLVVIIMLSSVIEDFLRINFTSFHSTRYYMKMYRVLLVKLSRSIYFGNQFCQKWMFKPSF